MTAVELAYVIQEVVEISRQEPKIHRVILFQKNRIDVTFPRLPGRRF